jgi:tetratricopeptide (TPR) repeat protein
MADSRPTNQSSPRRFEWRNAALLLAAGLLTAASVAAPASAQHRQDNNGRALDRNNRVGGDGTNSPRDTSVGSGPMVTGNQIVTGNVTGGRQFRGLVPYSDPGNFRGPTAGSLSREISTDRFVAESAGVPRANGPEVSLRQPTAFYGSRRATPPPVGYVPTVGATGGFIPTSPAAVTGELGNQPQNFGLDPTIRTGELMLPTLDQNNQQSILTASPLYGIRVWQNGTGPNDFLTPGVRPEDRGDRFRVDRNSIDRMRDEVFRAAGGRDARQEGGPGAEGDAPVPGAVQPLNTSIGAPAAQGSQGAVAPTTPGGGTVAAQPMTSALQPGALANSTATGQSFRQRLNVATDRQTPQLTLLRQHFERQGGVDSDVEANRRFNQERRAFQRDAAAQKGNQQQGQPGQAQPGQGQPGAGGAGGAGAGGAGAVPNVAPPARNDPGTAPANQAPSVPGQPAPERTPQQINSLAKDVPAEGLRKTLESAEKLMREQKFSQALEQYNVANDVAPNNGLIILGRANAQLAGSYYRRAESDLREAVAKSPEVVVAQFDLRSLVGEERLQVLVKDLKELASGGDQEARPLILLAYIAYNTGNEDQAAQYLAQAEQRVKGNDTLLQAWRKHWRLPEADAAPDDNK